MQFTVQVSLLVLYTILYLPPEMMQLQLSPAVTEQFVLLPTQLYVQFPYCLVYSLYGMVHYTEPHESLVQLTTHLWTTDS